MASGVVETGGSLLHEELLLETLLGDDIDERDLFPCHLPGCKKFCFQEGLTRHSQQLHTTFCRRSHAAAGSIWLYLPDEYKGDSKCCLPGKQDAASAVDMSHQ